MIIRLRAISISLRLAFMLVFLSGIASAESGIFEDSFDFYNSGAFPSFERGAGDRVGFNGINDVKVEDQDNLLKYADHESPLPEVIDISITNSGEVHEGESATISIIVVNNGDKSSEGYITVSLPNDEEILSVTGTGDGYYEIYPKGSSIPGKDGPISSSECPVVELQEYPFLFFTQFFQNQRLCYSILQRLNPLLKRSRGFRPLPTVQNPSCLLCFLSGHRAF